MRHMNNAAMICVVAAITYGIFWISSAFGGWAGQVLTIGLVFALLFWIRPFRVRRNR